jgi:uncharacterized protein (DUF302 family)
MKIPEGILRFESLFGVEETTNRLVVLIQNRGITVYARINQQRELSRIGIRSAPIEFILFGNPLAGGQIILANPFAALDLPLKTLIWEDAAGKTWVTYNDQRYIATRFNLDQNLTGLLNLTCLLKSSQL